MSSLKSLLPFWPHRISGEAAPAALPAKPGDFGKASSFELQFDRLMDDSETSRDTLFSTRTCRQ